MTKLGNYYNTNEMYQATRGAMGLAGLAFRGSLDGATDPTDTFVAIMVTADANIDFTDAITGTTFTGEDLLAGMTIPGQFTDITVNSGRVILFYGEINR